MAELTTTIPIAGRILGLSRNCAYGAAKAGTLPAVRFGRRLVVSIASLSAQTGIPEGELVKKIDEISAGEPA